MTRTHKATQAVGAVIMILAGIAFAFAYVHADNDLEAGILGESLSLIAFSLGLVFYIVGRAQAWWSE